MLEEKAVQHSASNGETVMQKVSQKIKTEITVLWKHQKKEMRTAGIVELAQMNN
jgi:hypothetical protein